MMRMTSAALLGLIMLTTSVAAAEDCNEQSAMCFGIDWSTVAANYDWSELDLQAKDSAGRTPMHWAALHSTSIAVLASLAEAGVDPTVLDANDDNAFDLIYSTATEGQNSLSQYKLGQMYDVGIGVVQDRKEAAKWYEIAAEQGEVSAQFNIGVMYRNGEGVERDLQQGFVWFTLAHENGIKEAAEGRKQLARELTADQIQEARAEVKRLRPTAVR